MILVMNHKSGVGCTILTYTIGRLFNLPIYFAKDSFFVNDATFDSEFQQRYKISTINDNIKDGIVDIGSNLSKVAQIKKFIKKSKLVIIPFHHDIETITKTIQTVELVRSFDEKIQIVLILNRLDRADEDVDFSYTDALAEILLDADIGFEKYKYNVAIENQPLVVLTYLRNSYSIFADLKEGKYFLDGIHEEVRSRGQILETTHDEVNKLNPIAPEDQYGLFLYFAYLSFKNTDYENETTYYQNKDFVMFRILFMERYENEKHIVTYRDGEFSYTKMTPNGEVLYTSNYKYNTTNFNKAKKLVKDLAYITHYVSKYV